MSILTLKDLDYYLFDLLQIQDLLSLSHINNYYHQLLNDKYCSNRYYKKYSKLSFHVENNITKKIYFENEKGLKMSYEEGKRFAIINDRVDLIDLIINRENKKLNYIDKGMAIEYDSVKCYKYFFSKNLFFCEKHTLSIIKYKSDKILQYIKDSGIEIIPNNIDFEYCFNYNSPLFIKLTKSKVTKELILDTLIRLDYVTPSIINYVNPSVIDKMILKRNDIFIELISCLSYEDIKFIRHKALENGFQKIIKLVTKYTSPFDTF